MEKIKLLSMSMVLSMDVLTLVRESRDAWGPLYCSCAYCC